MSSAQIAVEVPQSFSAAGVNVSSTLGSASGALYTGCTGSVNYYVLAASGSQSLSNGSSFSLFSVSYSQPTCVGAITLAPTGNPFAATGAGCSGVPVASQRVTVVDYAVFVPGGRCESIVPAIGGGPVSCDPNTPLPVELISFKAAAAGQTSHLTWSTATEIDNKGFSIERSLDGDEWEEIGFVEGNGTSDIVNNYEFTDLSPERGVNYYRLRQTDYDGRSELSDVESVTFQGNDALLFSAFPNPTAHSTTIAVPEGVIDVRVTDVTGRVVLERINEGTNGNQYTLDMSALAPATYRVQIVHAGEQHSLAIVRSGE